MDWHDLPPMAIEKRSFEIITQELGSRQLVPELATIVKRVIHTTADFDYADTLYFSQDAVKAGKDALLAGATIVTDTRMAEAGINKASLAKSGGAVRCFMSDPDVAASAKGRNVTRAVVSMEKARSKVR
jgi:precorrin-8X/cobalt-precorrin-8 methylmutase